MKAWHFLAFAVACLGMWCYYLLKQNNDLNSSYNVLLGEAGHAEAYLKQELKSVWSKLAETDAKRVLAELKNDSLNTVIKAQQGKIVSLTRTVIALESIVAGGAAHDTVFVDSAGVKKVRIDFNDRGKNYALTGHTMYPPAAYSVRVDLDPLIADVAILEEKNGKYRTLVSTNYGTVTGIESAFVPFKYPWYSKIGFTASLSVYDFKNSGVAFGAGYNGWIGSVGFCSFGKEYRVQRMWFPFRKGR